MENKITFVNRCDHLCTHARIIASPNILTRPRRPAASEYYRFLMQIVLHSQRIDGISQHAGFLLIPHLSDSDPIEALSQREGLCIDLVGQVIYGWITCSRSADEPAHLVILLVAL
jgi:hypothetical protein